MAVVGGWGWGVGGQCKGDADSLPHTIHQVEKTPGGGGGGMVVC